MTNKQELGGVIPAVVTPLRDGRLDLVNLERHLQQLRNDGSNGVLMLGTTGEGPSLSLAERQALIEATREFTDDMLLLAGTGCASLIDTIALTHSAFEAGADAVVVVPPFYFKGVSDEGLLTYYRRLLDDAIPEHGLLILYHIPQVTGVPISFGLLDRLLTLDSGRVAGIKDSSGDLEHGREICRRFPELRMFVGDDKLLYVGLRAAAVGCITAGGNLLAMLSATVYQKFKVDKDAAPDQAQLTEARRVLDKYTPFPASIKGLLALRYASTGWDVRPPLAPLPDSELFGLVEELSRVALPRENFAWLHEIAQQLSM